MLEIDEAVTRVSRDQLQWILRSENVLTRRYFSPGCHRSEPYRSCPSQADLRCPTERLTERVLCVPTGTAVDPGGDSRPVSNPPLCRCQRSRGSRPVGAAPCVACVLWTPRTIVLRGNRELPWKLSSWCRPTTGPKTCGSCWRRLAHLEVPAGLRWEVVIVDNNSADHTRRRSQNTSPLLPLRYTFERRQGRLTLAGGASSKPPLSLSPSSMTTTFLSPRWLAEALSFFRERPRVGAVGAQVQLLWEVPPTNS